MSNIQFEHAREKFFKSTTRRETEHVVERQSDKFCYIYFLSTSCSTTSINFLIKCL